jgi:hypothetical protein
MAALEIERCGLHPTLTTNDSAQPETAPIGRAGRSLTAPVGVCPASPRPAPCDFRLLGAAYRGVWAASGRGEGAADAREGLEESPESRTGHVRHLLYMTHPTRPVGRRMAVRTGPRPKPPTAAPEKISLPTANLSLFRCGSPDDPALTQEVLQMPADGGVSPRSRRSSTTAPEIRNSRSMSRWMTAQRKSWERLRRLRFSGQWDKLRADRSKEA